MKFNRVFYVLFVVVILLVIFCGMKFVNNNDDNPKLKISDYQYNLIYDFGGVEYSIYLLGNDDIKIVEGSPIYEACKGTDCIISSGNYEYKEYSLEFNAEAKEIIVNFIKDLFKKYNKNELRVDEITLTPDEERYLNGIVFNDDDVVTVNEDIEFETVVKEFKNEENNIIISNTAILLKESVDNKIVNKIGNYLNDMIREDFDNLNKDINSDFSFYKDNYNDEVLGVNFTLKMEWLGGYRISFRYITDGTMGGIGWYVDNGYTFNINNGEIVSEIPEGYKEDFYNMAVNNFMQQEIYINEKEQLEDNWIDILKTEMFNVGNWYETNDEVVFLIEAGNLGFDEATCKLITIKVKNPYGEF